MDIKEFVNAELRGWGKYERILFPLEILVIICISLLIQDSKIALISAICGICSTILAGKGKISCYLFGLAATICYAAIAFKNSLYGNFFLYICYYFPMQFWGIFKWKKHLKKDSMEIVKTRLRSTEKIICFSAAAVLSAALALTLKKLDGQTPYIDAITTVFSIIGLLLTIKRCIEQWYAWTIVNGLSAIMWIQAYINGSNCFATILMWLTYLAMGIYFLYCWEKDIKE